MLFPLVCMYYIKLSLLLDFSCRALAKFGTKLLGELLHELLHDGGNLLVVERLAVVLQDEVDRIGLLAQRQVLALIYVKEVDRTQQLLLGLVGNLLYLAEFHALVNEQRQVAAHRTRSGLVDALQILKNVDGIAQCYFTEKDVVRHRLVQEIIKAYEAAAHPAKR